MEGVMSLLEDLRDHLNAVIAGHDTAVASEQTAKTEALRYLALVEAELAKPEVAVTDQIKALVAKL
jgi:hypothetical protein